MCHLCQQKNIQSSEITLFIRLEDGVPDGYPISETNFRLLFPDTSFPSHFTADLVEPLGYGIYEISDHPESPGRYEKNIEVKPIRCEHGIWKQTWGVIPMSDAEKEAIDAAKAKEIRSERDWKLAACDWTQVADAPVNKAAWATYRQALRNMPEQEGFPWSVEWPRRP